MELTKWQREALEKLVKWDKTIIIPSHRLAGRKYFLKIVEELWLKTQLLVKK